MISSIEDILFPVEFRPIHFDTKEGKRAFVDSHRVVVNAETETPVGVVGKGYRLVTNLEALHFAQQCARQLFGGAKAEDLQLFKVYAPRNPWYCQVDFIHKGYEINILRGEVYLPFVRMTNSYNGSKALRFDVGYCRKICSNGMIFESETIRFKFTHSYAHIGAVLNFAIRKDQLDTLKARFESDAERLHGWPVPEGLDLPLFFKALGLPIPGLGSVPLPKQRFFSDLVHEADLKISTYYKQLGRNAYALLNATTDFASNPPELSLLRRTHHAMQAASGKWSQEFALELNKNGSFDIQAYLGEYINVATWMKHTQMML